MASPTFIFTYLSPIWLSIILRTKSKEEKEKRMLKCTPNHFKHELDLLVKSFIHPTGQHHKLPNFSKARAPLHNPSHGSWTPYPLSKATKNFRPLWHIMAYLKLSPLMKRPAKRNLTNHLIESTITTPPSATMEQKREQGNQSKERKRRIEQHPSHASPSLSCYRW